jgi:hypothetical protein
MTAALLEGMTPRRAPFTPQERYMATQFVHIIVDCEAIALNPNVASSSVIQMFADPTIVKGNSNGSPELAIQVNNQDDIRWTVYPKAPSTSVDDYTVIVDARKDWTDSSSAMLKNWAAYQGQMSIPVYNPDGQIMEQNANVNVMRMSGYLPYVEAHASFASNQLSGYTSEPEAYTFYLNIYKNNQDSPVATYNWDPYVYVHQP